MLLQDCRAKYINMSDKGLKWDIIKMEVRSITIPYCINKKRSDNMLKDDLQIQLSAHRLQQPAVLQFPDIDRYQQ